MQVHHVGYAIHILESGSLQSLENFPWESESCKVISVLVSFLQSRPVYPTELFLESECVTHRQLH